MPEQAAAASNPSAERLLIRVAIEDLVAEYTYHHDRGDAPAVRALLASDIRVQDPAGQVFVGADELIRRLSARPAERLVRHAVPSFHVVVEDRNHARAVRLMFYYTAEDGQVRDAVSPQAIAEYAESFARGNDGRWRIATRVITHLFGKPPT